MAITDSNTSNRTDSAIEPRVRAEAVQLLFQHARGAPVATLVAAILFASGFKDVVATGWLQAWLGWMVIVELSRMLLAWRFRSAFVAVPAISHWERLFLIGTACSALGWGLAAGFLFPHTTPAQHLLTAGLLVGLCGIAIPLLAANLRAYLVFVVPATAPAIFHLLLNAQPVTLAAAGGCAVGAGLLYLVARRLNRDMLEAVRARYAYADMAEEYDVELTTRLRAEDTIRRSEQRARRQNYILLDLAREDSIASGDLANALKAITTKAAQAITSNRVSIWLCNPEMTEFRCVHLFAAGEHDTSPDIVVKAGRRDPLYKRMERIRTFAISDTRSDRRVADFRENYLHPFRITSLLGAPIRHGGQVRGVICHEHVGMPRQWTRDEHAFASSLADFVSLAITSSGRQQAQEQLHFMANFDKLTGLANRAMFQDRVRHAITKAQRAGEEMALLFVDVDHFKKINDSLGHHVGDRVLRSIAKRLVRCVRSADTVARLGGDEFTIILENIENLETVIAVAERIIETVAEPLMLAENEINLTCSVGISHYPRDGADVVRLLQNSDAAMYRAKKLGRNRYQFFTEDMHTQALQRLTREGELRKALQRNELELQYQPQIDTRGGIAIGAEALVRWRHPEHGLVGPSEFIHLAEETGLIAHLGEWVLHEACRQAKVWHDELGADDFHIAVNLSVGQFVVRNIAQWVDEVLRETGLPRHMLLLEITESLAVGDAEAHLQLLSDLKDLGVQLALDDFGTGNSSLSYLKRFPVDMLKIDRSFVQEIEYDLHDEAIARATIGLASSLGLEVVAEGVETEAQRRWLERENCYLMQGYLFSKPLPAEECVKWLVRDTGAKILKRTRKQRA